MKPQITDQCGWIRNYGPWHRYMAGLTHPRGLCGQLLELPHFAPHIPLDELRPLCPDCERIAHWVLQP